jgi:methionyl-tRNA formyltransferase
MKLVFAGTPEFAAVALNALLDAGHDIELVLTQPDRPAGRGLKAHSSAVKALAQARNLSLLQPLRLGEDIAVAVAAAKPDAVVVAAYGLIVPPGLLQMAPRGCLNIHASLLPRWRGAAPIQRALLAGDLHTGVTIMQMDAGLDTGPILIQEALTISADETAGTLHDKLAVLGARLIVRALESNSPPQPQDGALATYARKLGKAEAQIDWQRPAAEIERQVRAFDPVPGAETTFEGLVVKIRRSRIEPGATGVPGSVCSAGPGGIVVACGSDRLRVLELQRAGGKRLPAGDFLAGFRLLAGARLGAGHG